MVLYECSKCNKVYNHLGNYKKHMLRKKDCGPKQIIQPTDTSTIQITPIAVKNYKHIKKTKEDYENKDNCPYCFKLLNKKNIIRHIKMACKNTPSKIKDKYILKTHLRNMKKEISKMQTKKTNIVNFGNETTTHITRSILLGILIKPQFNILNFLNLIYIDCPTNRNFYMANVYKDFVSVLKNNKICIVNLDKHIIDLANKMIILIRELCNSFGIIIPTFINIYLTKDNTIIHNDIYNKCKLFIKSNAIMFRYYIKENYMVCNKNK